MVLNNLEGLIYHKTQPTNQPTYSIDLDIGNFSPHWKCKTTEMGHQFQRSIIRPIYYSSNFSSISFLENDSASIED